MAFTRFTKNVLNVSALPDRVQNQAQTLKATFDQAGVDIKAALNALIAELEASTSADNIGADVQSVATKTVQAILTAFEEAIADRYTKTEAETLLAIETNNLLADLDINLTTGVITTTKKDGTKVTFDTAIEKVPSKFEFVESGDTYLLKITNVDGTTTQADVTKLMNIYNFNNSDYITFEVTGEGNKKTVSANIKANSIGLDKLSLSVVSTLEGYMNSARDSATAAKTSETNARASELNALEAKNTATTKAQEASKSATKAAESAEEAEYWAKQTQGNAQGGDMLKSIYDTNGDGTVDKADNGIIILEASTDNVIDFNTLTEPGVYLIKNTSNGVGTTLNGVYTNDGYTIDTYLEVRKLWKADGQLHAITQTAKINSVNSYYRSKSISTDTWTEWDYHISTGVLKAGTLATGMKCETPTANTELANKNYVDTQVATKADANHSQGASTITAGTLAGKVLAQASSVATLTNSQLRNIKAQTTDLTAGTSALTTGDIVLIYE